jgi:hypothetical protein
MKKKFIIMLIVINIITLPLFSQDDIPLNEIPMYDGDKITEYYKKINQDFINDVKKIIETKKQFKDLNEASKYSMNKGWDAFNNGDYLTSIKRFNQAWLLDPNNPDVYWIQAMFM